MTGRCARRSKKPATKQLDGGGRRTGSSGRAGVRGETALAHGYAANKESHVKRLHRIEGQVRGIEKMVEDDRYCIDIITQISAVSTALDAVAIRILDDHVDDWVAALASGDEEAAAEKARELLDAVHRFTRARGGGIVGIHGTNKPWLLGQAVSHGCVRVANSAALVLKRLVLLGSRITIVQ